MKRMQWISLGHRQSSRVLASFFSTATLKSPSSFAVNDLIYRIKVVRDPMASVVPVLDKWVAEGRTVSCPELRSLVRAMRDLRRFSHALEISQWMTDRRYFILSPTDVAVRLDLIFRVRGIEHMEVYFDNISKNLKSVKAYCALLCGYVREKSTAEAEAIVQKMRETGFATTSYPYNMLISLYSKTGEYGKMDILMREMEDLGIPHDIFTLRCRIKAYALACDISGMEKSLNRIEEDPAFVVDWQVFVAAATGYLKVGLIKKALEMLNKMEGTLPPVRRKLAFEHLLSLYASTGSKDDLYRVWNLYKPLNEAPASSYCVMITSLAKLDDIEGCENIFQEWESKCTTYDFRVLHRLLVVYCRKGHFDKAELVVKKAIEGRTPLASTWNILAMGYMHGKQMDKALEMFRKALLVGRRVWRPYPATLDACLEYLDGQGDVEGMEEIVTLLHNTGALTRNIYHRLLRASVEAGKSVYDVLDQMEMEGFTADEETTRILERRPSL